MAKKKLHDLRLSYHKDSLNISEVNTHPLKQFEIWFNEALADGNFEANAMVLATTGNDLNPSARIVLLKEYSETGGFVFFTNYESKKGQQIKENPKASLLFFWPILERQIRIEGIISKIDAAESDAYFAARPKESQLGAICSPQSSKIDEAYLNEAFEKAKTLQKINRPQNWGGYSLKANYFEFWQGKPNRLHDRITYSLQNKNWKIERIAP